MRRQLGRAAGVLMVMAAVAACGSQPEVEPDALAGEISRRLTEQVGQVPDDVACPEVLTGEVGATTTCVLTEGGMEYDVEVTVTAVEGEDVGFDIQVADQPS